MVRIRIIGFILAVGLSAVASADVKLAFHSYREQSDSFDCWAYAASFMIEARALVRDNINLTLDTTLDLGYWVDFDRLLSIYHTKEEYDWDPFDSLGDPVEFMYAFLTHGRNILFTEQNSSLLLIENSAFDFSGPLIGGFGQRDSGHMTPKDDEIVKNLLAMNSESDALSFITKTLTERFHEPFQGQTKWFSDSVELKQTPRLAFGSDYSSDMENKFVDVAIVKDLDAPKWIRILNNRFWALGVPVNYDLTKLAKASLDKGWPTVLGVGSHAVTLLQYSGSNPNETKYVVVDPFYSKTKTFVFAGDQNFRSEVYELFLYYPAVENILPAHPE
jgi:hypothetical protein